jgi:O-antigen/teichoic acid export membrane protein
MSSKEKIFKNTALIASSSFINMAIGIVRNKVFAIYLGAVGMGQFGVVNDLITSVFNFTSLGLSNSGVQAISTARPKGEQAVAIVYNSLMRVTLITGFISTVLLAVFSGFASQKITGDQSYTWIIRIAAISVLLKAISGLQGTLINGMQRIKLLAKSYIYQGLVSSGIAIILAILLGTQSIPYIIIAIAAGSWFVTLIQSQTIQKELPRTREILPIKQVYPIIILGLTTMWGSTLNAIVMLITKSSISHKFGKADVGYFQAALGLTSTYIGFITSAISKDFYPRLSAMVHEGKERVNAVVNEQIGISISLIMPFLLTFLIFSEFFLSLLYSKEFIASNILLLFTIAATFIRVISWPIAFVFLAHRASKIYFLTETLGNLALLAFNLLAIYLGKFSLIGPAYLAHYICYLAVVTFFYYRFYNGKITGDNGKIILVNSVFISLVVCLKLLAPKTVVYLVGVPVLLAYLYFSRKEIKTLLRSLKILK